METDHLNKNKIKIQIPFSYFLTATLGANGGEFHISTNLLKLRAFKFSR